MNKHGCSWWLPISAASDFAFWQLSLVNTFPICLHVTDCHLTLSHLEESQASCCVIDRTGKELPGRRDTADVTSGMITDHPTPADNIRAPIILSDELLEERTEKLRLLLMGWIVTLSTQRSGTSIICLTLIWYPLVWGTETDQQSETLGQHVIAQDWLSQQVSAMDWI